eukprot:5434921-Lingulodinium_polyedra.AAC.1
MQLQFHKQRAPDHDQAPRHTVGQGSRHNVVQGRPGRGARGCAAGSATRRADRGAAARAAIHPD